ncbi:MAG: FecR domain-containing protein [bacterium]
MKAYRIKYIFTLHSIQVLLMIGCLIVCNDVSSKSMPSNYINIEEICRASDGTPLSEVLLVKGSAVIIREKISHSCWAQRDLSLFEKDIISTQENSRLRFGYVDGSLVTLSSMTELEITRNIYDRAAKVRSLFFNMHSGKARFYVCKLEDFELSEAKVKTNTAIVVAIGSDFFIEGTDKLTRVIALKDTRLEIISLAAPEIEPSVITDFEQTIINEGTLPSEPEKVPQKEIEQILKEYHLEEMDSVPPEVIKCEDIFFTEDRLVEPDLFLKPGKEGLISEQMEDPWIKDKEIPLETSEVADEALQDENEVGVYVPQFPRHP